MAFHSAVLLCHSFGPFIENAPAPPLSTSDVETLSQRLHLGWFFYSCPRASSKMMPSLNRKMRSIVCKQERQGSSYDGDVEIENYKSGLVSNFSFETSETIKTFNNSQILADKSHKSFRFWTFWLFLTLAQHSCCDSTSVNPNSV